MIDNGLLSREELFRITVSQSSVALTVQDDEHRLVLVNPAYCKLVGYHESELLGRDPVDDLLAPESLPQTMNHRTGKSLKSDLELPSRFTLFRELIHREGRRISVRLEVASAKGLDGSRLWCTTLIDLSGQQLALNTVLQRQDLMVREANHRVKNNLHGLLAVLELHSFQQPQLKPALDAVAARIGAVASLHGLQFAAGTKVEPVSLVESMAEGVAQTFACDFDWAVKDDARESGFFVKESHAVTVSLVLNELLTNACKHRKGNSPLSIEISLRGPSLEMRLRNAGMVSSGFLFEGFAGTDSGLGLLHSLVPDQGLSIAIGNDDSDVVTTMQIGPPLLVSQTTE